LEPYQQVDQIGRTFAYILDDCFIWVAILKMTEIDRFFATYFIQGERSVLILTKNCLGYILGDFLHKLICSACLTSNFCMAEDQSKDGIENRISKGLLFLVKKNLHSIYQHVTERTDVLMEINPPLVGGKKRSFA
jgi:hypothetical protein